MQIAEHLSFTHQPPQIFSMGIATRSSRFRAVESSKAPPPSFIAQYSVDNAADIRPTVSAVITGNEDDRDESDENDDEYQEEKNEEKMEKVKEMAGLQRRNVDDDNSFWQTYVSESGKFDKEMIDTWNENLDSLLLFATLFSAINTSFIIETYKRLQPDAIESTNSLLKLMLQHRNDDQKIDLEDQHWTPPFAAVRTNTMLFASLTSSVLAAFGAILGKEMLAEYKSAGALNTIPEQGRQRQKKFDALVRYRFRLLMQVLPIMLQLSLALFLLGVIDFLLPMSRAVATVIFVPASFGFILYIVSLVVAIKREDAPFQTSVSKSCRSLLRRVGHVRPGAIRDGIHRSIESVWRQLQLSLSKLDPIFQFLSATSVSPAVQRGSRKLYSAFHSSVLDMLGWWRRVWDKLDTVVSVTLYIGVLGVMGWFIMGWEALLSALGASEWTAAQALVENERDAISGDCAMWLLENSHDTKVIRETLEYIPFLPADILFRRFRAQPKILERYILMYKSTLQPQAGDMSLYLDEETQKDSIICGRALFHVLKLREEEDRKRIAFTTGGNSELLEVLGSETDVSDKFDLSLLTVFHCILTQSEGKDITEQNFRFLHILLKRYLDKLQKRSAGDPLCASSSSSQNQSSTTTTLTLLLDSGIFLVSQRHPINHYPVGCECDDKLEGVLEDILATVHEILGDQPMSMSLSSHVALLIAAIQWFKHKAGEVSQTTQGETLGFNGVKLVHIRKAWLAPDTRADFFDNVILAFKLIGSNNSAATKSLYLDLLTFTENFMPRVMDVSRGNDEWNVWFAKMIQIIPGMLQLLRQVQSEEHVREGYPSAIRILSRLLPDDWTPKDVKEILRKHEYAKLHILSPLRREYGAIMVRLVSFFLSSKATIPVSALTRRSIAEVLGWMVVCSRNLPLLIKQTTLYQQSTSVPSFLLSVMEGAEAPIGLVELCNYHLTLLLEMSPEELAPVRSVQLETFALVLASIPRLHVLASDKAICQRLVTLLNENVASRGQVFWPDSFEGRGLIKFEEGPSGSTVVPTLMDFLDGGYCEIWCGDGLTILWEKLSGQDSFNAVDHPYMFGEDVILTILDYFEKSVSLDCQISCKSVKHHLECALSHARMNDEMRSRINITTDLLGLAVDHGWEAMGLEHIMENIRNASLGAESRDDVLKNLMHAFNRLSLGDSNATIDLYLELLDHTEELDVPRTSIEWSLKVIQLIPAFLRLLRDFKENPEAGYSTIRVISCLLPTDWSPKAMRNLKMRDSERQLQVLSPLHPVYGNDIIDLINLILSPHTTSSPSPNTRRSLGEVLGWMAIAAASTGKLRSLIDSSIGLYQQPTTTIPVFLASLMSEKESSPHLVRLCGYHLQLLLEMPSQQLSSVQSEALVIALTNESIAKITFPGIVTLIDGLTQSDPDISWPTSFVKFKIVEWAEGSSQGKVLRFAKKRPMRDFFKEASVTWRGEGLLILWRTLLVQKDVDVEDHPHIFREEVIQTVLDCFNEAVSRNCQVSCPTMEDYLEKALQYGRLKDEMKVNIKKAMGDLNRVVKQGWNAIVRKDNPEGVNAKKSQRWSWPDEV
ncbi:hypothetical protein FRC03_003692 [Tulasnella sp. 419]|nr:hypothetical protein FRC03_003692 [Tulasnella sp. 419]